MVLVDGEHYPPVIVAALDDLAARGTTPVAALFLGGSEKVAAAGAPVDVGVLSRWVTVLAGERAVEAAARAVAALLTETGAEVVVDLSDEPVLDQRHRLQLAAHVLHLGVPYEGADFVLSPPPRPRLATRPTIAIIGTGKRTGKTAVTGAVVRALVAAGRTPVVVAMGRGGPPEPVVVPAGQELDPAALLAVADAGGHAASDFYEDAATTGVATVGARRCGGGLAGGVGYSNLAAAVAAAERLPGDVTLLEGSGASIPPAHADATLLVVPGDAEVELVTGYLGGYRVLLADVVVATMCEPPRSAPDQVDTLLGAIRNTSAQPLLLRTVLRPLPLGEVTGAKVFFATTAPAAVTARLCSALAATYACEVVGSSSHLADRPALRADLAAAPRFEVLLVELKAAAVDVAARSAIQIGARVVFCDNRPVGVDDDAGKLDDMVGHLLGLAERRHAAR